MDPSQKITLLIICILAGMAAFLVVGYPLLRRWGTKVGGGLFTPGDENFQIRPEYSLAEARAAVGRYAEAVAEFRKASERFPAEVFPHIRIAELALDRLDDVELAERELWTALAKAEREDAAALAANRLADLYEYRLQQPARAREVLEQLRAKVPGTQAARWAGERLTKL
jgi:tetratricopeptide (TPR) repeat protein